MRYRVAIGFLAIAFISGCGSSPQPVKCENRPWMMNPNSGGNIGSVGSANRTYSGGNNSQRTLAITRALDELSLQQGVKVTQSISKSESVVNDKVNTAVQSDSTYKSSGKITAHIEDACKSNISGEFFVWMLLD